MANKRIAATILRKAANLIEEKGWTRGNYCNDGAYCALGAINKTVQGAPGHDYDETPDQLLAMNAMRKVVGGSIPDYNDTEAGSAKEVIRTMRKTARELEHGLKVTV